MKAFASLLLLNLLIFTLQAGYQYEFWLLSNACSGDPTYSYKSEGDCGISSDSNNNRYVKVTYELGTGDYTVYEYNDKDCKDESRNFKVKNNELDKCLTYLISSYKFKIFFVCFAGESQVLLPDNQYVKLSDLQVGQSIATYGENQVGFSEVYTFLDYQKDIYLDFLELHFIDESGKAGKIAISHEHLILAKRKGGANFVQAKDVKVGDYIFKNSNGTVSPVVISSVTIGKYKGAFAPATMDGTVLVNDIVVSSYAGISHNIAHTIFSPLRLAYKISPSLVSSELNGMHPYAKILYDSFYKWVQHPLPIYAPHSLESN